jgi:hypothetical protein
MRTLDDAGRRVPEGDSPEAISTLEPIPSADDIEDDATIGKTPIISAADHGGEEDGGGGEGEDGAELCGRGDNGEKDGTEKMAESVNPQL